MDNNESFIQFKGADIDINESVDYILDLYKKSNKKEIIVVNIGTDKLIADSFGPIIGACLIERNTKLKVYGDLESPIHALNIKSKVEEINKLHPDAFIIATDSAIGSLTEFKRIRIRNSGVQPGSGSGKNLGVVGDMGITLVVADNIFSGTHLRLGVIYKIANEISKVIIALEERLKH